MTPPFPISHYLVPPPGDAVPEGFTALESPIAKGLPHSIDLTARLRLKLTVPTGLARQWLDVPGDTIISASDDQAAAFDPAAPAMTLAGQVPRLAVIKDGRLAGIAPLTLGPMWRFPAVGASLVELTISGWRISAAALRGPISDGSFAKLAWREADRSVAHFGPPPISTFVIHRLPKHLRIESLVGRHLKLKYRGHLLKSMVLHGRS